MALAGAAILRLQMGLKSQAGFPIFKGKTRFQWRDVCSKNDTFETEDYSERGDEIEKPNTTELCRANVCRLHKHRVYSAEHNAANDGLFWGFCWFFFHFNVQIQGNVKEITPLYNLSPLVRAQFQSF